MKSVDTWFSEYGESHRNPTNKTLHWICVPLIVLSILGMLMSIPVPSAFAEIPYFNWASLTIVLALLFYVRLSIPLSLGMILFSVLSFAILDAIATYVPYPLWQVSIAVFVLAWIGQFIGHNIEGKKPSFFKDLQFLLIGPIWLLGFLYKRLHIAY